MRVEIARTGTRGAGVLDGPLRAVAVRVALLGHRLGFRRQMGNLPVLLLTTRGSRSGRVRTAPLMCFPQEEGAWLVVASAGGATRHPNWVFNLARHPEDVWLDVDGRKVRVTPKFLHGAERDDAWRSIVDGHPRFATFEERTDRELPVVLLTTAQ